MKYPHYFIPKRHFFFYIIFKSIFQLYQKYLLILIFSKNVIVLDWWSYTTVKIIITESKSKEES